MMIQVIQAVKPMPLLIQGKQPNGVTLRITRAGLGPRRGEVLLVPFVSV